MSESRDCLKIMSESKDCLKIMSESRDCLKIMSESKDCLKIKSESRDCLGQNLVQRKHLFNYYYDYNHSPTILYRVLVIY